MQWAMSIQSCKASSCNYQMIVFAKLANRWLGKNARRPRFHVGNGKESEPKGELAERDEKVSLMEDTFEQVKMKGLEERSITGIDSFQRDILTQNKFDLLNPKIQPQIASLSTTIGLDVTGANYLAEINLGKIKVKKENEVFLSEVDPYNIPEYYDIVFDYEKEMSLVGKKVEGSKGKEVEGKEGGGEMNISTRKAFEEKSEKELMKQTFGVELSYVLNSRIAWKQFVAVLFVSYFLSFPITEAIADYYVCMDSISEIEEERMKHVNQLRREAMISAIVNHPDMSIQ